MTTPPGQNFVKLAIALDGIFATQKNRIRKRSPPKKISAMKNGL
jgi:hypothetical protein